VQLVPLFQNLVSNAIQYRSEHPPRIDIRAEERETDVLFSVLGNRADC
jgi:light-regulated signal transduction histidine kinase (bacteriophytochrome)